MTGYSHMLAGRRYRYEFVLGGLYIKRDDAENSISF
jgi:hypothetical protein